MAISSYVKGWSNALLCLFIFFNQITKIHYIWIIWSKNNQNFQRTYQSLTKRPGFQYGSTYTEANLRPSTKFDRFNT